jgi:predicted outer membrane protein
MIAMSRFEATKLSLVAFGLSLIVACGHDEPRARPSNGVVVDTAGGEVVGNEPASPPPRTARWITDANALSLASAVNTRAIAAADVELENWHVDTARAFAASMAREHAELQHSIDSIAARLNVTPVIPALAKQWTSAMQAQIDTIWRAGEAGLDLAFVRQQITSHQRMSDYFTQLAAVSEHPELRAFLETAAAKSASLAQRASALQPTVARIDSIRREARRRGSPP